MDEAILVAKQEAVGSLPKYLMEYHLRGSTQNLDRCVVEDRRRSFGAIGCSDSLERVRNGRRTPKLDQRSRRRSAGKRPT